MRGLEQLLAHPVVYRLWQAPFSGKKIVPLVSRVDLSTVRRVLDVACGPGTNAHLFVHADYLGIDLNERYVASARQRKRGRFLAADAISWSGEATEQFDFILVNSFLHHLDDRATVTLLRNLSARLAPAGKLHLLELVLPPDRGVARLLARADRGHHARPLDAWRRIIGATLQLEWFEPYTLGIAGIPLWRMVYAAGSPKR